MGLATPYAKADLAKRLFAASIDATLIATILVAYGISKSWKYILIAAAYSLLRDAVVGMGRSIGKFLCGLVVINLGTGRPCGFTQSVGRNIVFLLPGANLIAVFFEATTIVRDPQGQRLGDRFALTQVVEGFGAKEVLAQVQEWWLRFVEVLDQNSGRPDREPVRQPH